MKSQSYKEQYKICVFFARVNYYSVVGNDSELVDKCDDLLKINNKFPLFGDPKSLNKISNFFSSVVPSISWIFKIPFIKDNWSTDPLKSYQKWCKVFDGKFTNEEVQKIVNDNAANDYGHDWQADVTWNLIQEQKKYIPFISEIKWIYNKYKYGKHFVTVHHR